MSSFRSFLAGAGAALAVAGLALWLWPRAPGPAPEVPGTAPEPPERPTLAPPGVVGPTVAPEAPPAAAVPEPPPAAGHVHEPDAEAAKPDDDLLLYEREPMSRVPHQVVRAWGATEDRQQAGRVGAYVVVDPSISDQELILLARDIRDYHRGATAVTVRILDSEEAAAYDYHEDGGVRRDQHLVGRVQRDTALGVDAIQVRGETIEP